MGKKKRLANNMENLEKLKIKLQGEWQNLRIYIGLGFLTLGILLGLTVSARAEIFNIRIFILCVFAGLWTGSLLIFCLDSKVMVFLRLLSGILYSILIVVLLHPPLLISFLIFMTIGLLSYFVEKSFAYLVYIFAST